VARVLVLTADVPYFPGKMGVDFFNLRYLAARHRVEVVGPVYPQFPEAGVDNLRRAVSATWFWPEERPGVGANPPAGEGLRLPRLARLLPRSVRRALLHALLGLEREDDDGLVKLAVLSNLTPYLLAALGSSEWDALVIVQSDTRPWLDYLPAHLPLAVYFHDVRSHYLARRAAFERRRLRFERQARRAERQERQIAERADAVGFVSRLDLTRAEATFGPLSEARVAPIPIDLDYFTPRPADFARDGRQVVLFTGHLMHPPNQDAARFFLEEVWPLVRARHPRAVFQIAGALPEDELRQAVRRTPGAELHADVPDIRPFFWNAAAYVVPMRFGGGVRQKILEAWAMEVPLVLTPMAAEGSGIDPEVVAGLPRDAPALAARVNALLDDPTGAAAEARGARERVRAAHDLDVACPRFEELVRAAVEARRGRPRRVLLDLAWLRPDDDGAEARRARALVAALLRHDTRRHYRLLAPLATLTALHLPASSHVSTLPSDGWRLRAHGLRRALASLLAESLATHQPVRADLGRLELLRLFEADVVHAFGLSRPRASALLPSIVSLEDDAVPAGGAAEAARRARALLCDDDRQRARLLARLDLDPARVHVCARVEDDDGRAVAAQLGRLYDASLDAAW
jgi:glycosyltransferase involved in cell wall biosynthesis